MFKMIILFVFPVVGKIFNMPFLDTKAEKFLVQIIKSRLEDGKRNTKNDNQSFLDVFVKALENSESLDKHGQEEKNENATDQFEDDAKIKVLKAQQNFYLNQDEFQLALISNLFLLFFAGFDTQSTAMSSILYYLATNPESMYFSFQ